MLNIIVWLLVDQRSYVWLRADEFLHKLLVDKGYLGSINIRIL